jgi:hypothetical protein
VTPPTPKPLWCHEDTKVSAIDRSGTYPYPTAFKWTIVHVDPNGDIIVIERDEAGETHSQSMPWMRCGPELSWESTGRLDWRRSS